MKLAIISFIFTIYILLIIPSPIISSVKVLNSKEGQRKINQYIIDKILQCESENKHHIWGDLNYIYPAYGIAQFQKRTFLWLSKIAGKKNRQWKNKEHQIELLIWAIENGHGRLWTCYRWYKRGII